MMAATIMMGRALAPVEQVVANWRRFSTMRAAHGRLAKLFAEFPERTAATELPAPLGHLSIEGLVIVPPNAELPSVKGATFSATPGECLAIMGASGSGKSSIARAVANVWPAAKGDVRLDGAALPQWDADLLGRHIGYVPQEVELFAGTISENIARMGVPADEAVIAAAKAAGLHEAIVRLKKGYDTVLGPGGTGLSGGMRQRVALARALYGNPKLVVLDEPNASLDADGEAALNDTIRRLKSEKVTIVVVTHRPQLVMQADKVLIMNAGQVQAFGPREAVLQKIAAVRQSGPRAAATTAAA
jgi:ATP-binding cassette subfamily C protein/ATP-binding cassette subfamily C protein EexD